MDLDPADQLPADMICYYSSVRAACRPEAFDLQFAVRVAGVVRVGRREGEMALNQKLVVALDDIVRGEPLDVVGATEVRRFVGLDPAPAS